VGGTSGTHGRGKKVYKVLVGKLQGKGPSGRMSRRWKDRIRMDLEETAGGGGGSCEYGDEPSGSVAT
jgi:hypothetical protein